MAYYGFVRAAEGDDDAFAVNAAASLAGIAVTGIGSGNIEIMQAQTNLLRSAVGVLLQDAALGEIVAALAPAHKVGRDGMIDAQLIGSVHVRIHLHTRAERLAVDVIVHAAAVEVEVLVIDSAGAQVFGCDVGPVRIGHTEVLGIQRTLLDGNGHGTDGVRTVDCPVVSAVHVGSLTVVAPSFTGEVIREPEVL